MCLKSARKLATLLASLTVIFVGELFAQHVRAAETITFPTGKPDGMPLRVVAVVEVGGNLKMSGAKGAETVPMSVVAQFGYDEQRLDDGSEASHRLALRYYDDAQAVIKIASKVTKPQLRADRRLIAAFAGKQEYLSSPNGPLTREESELIDVPANTLLLDELLPHGESEVGRRWKPSDDALAQLLCLDAIGHSEVECALAKVENGVAEITLEGSLGAAIDGVATQIEVKAKLQYEVTTARPKSVLLAIKEQRGIGVVGPGLDIVAKLKLTITTQPDSKLLTPEIVQTAKLPQSDEPPPLEYRSDSKGYRFEYDRRWHITRDDPDVMVMRYVNRGELVAQCNLASSTTPIAKPVQLADYQNDVQQALGKMFGRFERASENSTPSGLRTLRAIVSGKAEDLTVQWRYYLVHDQQGRVLSIVYTMETPFVEQFGDDDQPIINSVQFMEPKLAAGAQGTRK